MSDEEQLLQYQAYQLQAHDVATHSSRTMSYLRRLHIKAGKRIDVWDELTAHRAASDSGVTGPAIKRAFRSFVGNLQGNRCCYCRRWLQNIAHAKPVEHILCRKDYPQFSLHFYNLAVACFDCNLLKKDAKWGSVAVLSINYPVAANINDFYHPRFHRYPEHVSYERTERDDICNVTYTGLTPQGKHLCDQLLYITAARENFFSNNPSIAEAMVSLQQFQDRHAPGELPALEAFRKSLNESMHKQLDNSALDGLPLKGRRAAKSRTKV
ncbi:HNH endonuclease [Pseudomonas fontis]|uniref:HNH endonuclease n=1 Tax=Pseudomonas fontis TaxID=2942633 RepID=A0ABT5NQ84_9PSED|nr:hypothetical protein [Pseudomonas fontis]MDD0974994.1 hypothetical protein [Pseudomonas fontis]MDD0990334.1 hypothetical protein [Pseudomonas fontis]